MMTERSSRKRKRTATEEVEEDVWVRWHLDEIATCVHVTSETNIHKFIKAALLEFEGNLKPQHVYIAGFKNINRSLSSQEILDPTNSFENPLVITAYKREQPPVTTFRHATLGRLTPSEYAKKGSCWTKAEDVHRIYNHWFALEAYNSYCAIDLKGDIISINLAGQEFRIEKNSLEDFVHKTRALFKDPSACASGYLSTGEILSKEVTLTSVLCNGLDRFLFPGQEMKKGGCFHRLPCKGIGSSVEAPDFFLLRRDEKGCPIAPILIGDFKLKKEVEAFHETVAYAIRSTNIYHHEQVVVLGLAATQRCFKLLLCKESGAGKLQVTTLVESNIERLESFCCILYGCVHYLIDNPIRLEVPLAMAVRCDSASEHDHVVLSQRVVKCVATGKVHKFYDTEEYEQSTPNYDLIKRLDLLPDANLKTLSIDGRFSRLDYAYIEEDPAGRTIKLQDYILLFKQLSKLHQEDLVHSDIRARNIVYTKDGAILIDFDLTDKEGVRYPNSYAFYSTERHPEARPPAIRKKIRYALLLCMKQRNVIVPDEVEKKLNSIEVPLVEVCDLLKTVYL